MYNATVTQRTYARRGTGANVLAPRPSLSLQDVCVVVCILFFASAFFLWCSAPASSTSLRCLMVGFIICIMSLRFLDWVRTPCHYCVLLLTACGRPRDVIGQCEMVAPPPM